MTARLRAAAVYLILWLMLVGVALVAAGVDAGPVVAAVADLIR